MNIKLYMFLIGIILFCQSMFAQESGEMIRGKLASDLGEELISATIVEIDATGRVMSNALTDMNGEFSMKIKSTRNKLKFSYVGFKTQEILIGTRRDFQITLQENTTLAEVTITAKRTVSRGGMDIPTNEVSNATQRISTDVFMGVQIPSIDDALQGHIAGLDIIGSGNIGMGAQMRIRGISSLNSNSNPLIVINGIMRPDIETSEFDFSGATDQQFADLLMLNPEDIQEIAVLKDAGATAIYGSRGASGVLEIITKRGIRGRTQVNYNYKFLGAEQPQGLKMLNGDDYTMLTKQARFNPSQNPGASDFKEYSYDPTWSEYRHYNNNTDWRKAVTQRGITNEHYLVVTGGGDRAQFRVTGGYMTKSGTVIGQNWDRITSRMTLDYEVSSRIRFSSELSFTHSDNDQNWSDGRNDYNKMSILELAYKKMPNMSIYHKDENGRNLPFYYTMMESSQLFSTNQGKLRNPVALARLATNNSKSYNIDPVFSISYDLIDRGDRGERMLRYQAYIKLNIANSKSHKFLPKEVSPLHWSSEDINRVEDGDSESLGTQSENKLIWKPNLGENHDLRILASLQTTSSTSNGQSVLAYGFPDEHISAPYAPAYVRQVGSSIGQGRSLGMNANAHYAFRSKYIADVTFRREGSTKFGRNNKFGNFPGVSLRWNISDESFMKNLSSWLTMFSLRPSWGITGNAPKYEYMHFSNYRPWSSYSSGSTIRPDNIRLSNLRWEKSNEFNLGTDIELWNGRFSMDANVYRKITSDLLNTDAPLPGSTGFDKLLYRNSGSMRNEGWELNMHGNRFLKIRDFSFDAYFNLANSVNTLLSLDQNILDTNNKDFESGNRNAPYKQHLEVGHPYGSIYGFRYKGVYQYSIDNPALIESDYTLGTSPVSRDANGEIIRDSKGNPLPMYYCYGPQGRNYRFAGGDAIYEDINHDGQIDENDIVYLGNCNPKLNGGFGLTIRWKGLTCNAYFNFRYGNKIINSARRDAESMLSNYNQSIATNYRWRRDGDLTMMPRALYDYGWNSLPSDRYVEDGSFVRFKTLAFNYNVPSALLNKYRIKQMTLSLNFANLLCLTKYQGVDPEVGYGDWGMSNDNSITPRSRDITMGFMVGF